MQSFFLFLRKGAMANFGLNLVYPLRKMPNYQKATILQLRFDKILPAVFVNNLLLN